MDDYDYPLVPGTKLLPYIDTSVPTDVDDAAALPASLTSPPPPVRGGKNLFAFWNTGLPGLPPYMRRCVLEWHRRLSPLSWSVYVVDTVPNSALHVSHFVDTSDPEVVPEAFINGELSGKYAAQHTSDLMRFPLLLRWGGAYMDTGILLFGDLDHVWSQLTDPASSLEFLGFTMGAPPDPESADGRDDDGSWTSIVNFAMAATPDNPLVRRAHAILLQLWRGRTGTEGMHKDAVVAKTPLMRVSGEVTVTPDKSGGEQVVVNDGTMTDYAIQIQALGTAARWRDPEDGWDGPRYMREQAWLMSFLDAAMVGPQLTAWNGQREWELMALEMPPPARAGADKETETETEDQRAAREVVEKVVGGSWCMKLGHGFSAALFGDTLGMIWRRNPGSDCKPGTYAAWMRWAAANCTHETPLPPMKVPEFAPTRVERLQNFLSR